MRWEDIPQFIASRRCYHVDHSLQTYIDTLDKWQEDEYFQLQMTPDFQRGHVWTEEQQTAYMEYLFHGGQTGREFYFNDPRWKSMRNNATYNDFVCVDGLQRTTAIRKFLNNELRVFGCYYADFDRPLRFGEQSVSIYINDLKSKEEVLHWYIQMNSGGTPHTQQEIDKVKALLEECKK